MQVGLYRMKDTLLGECAHVDWSLGDGAPLLTRTVYEELNCKPIFDELPSYEEYSLHHTVPPYPRTRSFRLQFDEVS